MALELPQDFKEFLNLLRANSVEYLLIGAYAVGYHGYPRATRDLDIWIAATRENAERVVQTLKEFGFDLPELSVTLYFRQTASCEWAKSPCGLKL